MIAEPCPACRGPMEDVVPKKDQFKMPHELTPIAMKCFRCNIRFDFQNNHDGHWLETREDVIRNWNETVRRLREQAFQ